MTISQFDRENMESILHGEGTWFNAHLLRLIDKADLHNRERLRMAFPDAVEAYEAWFYHDSEGRKE
mgnify:CR=1 FL=1